MHARVQGFHTAIHHFGEVGDFGYIAHGDVVFAQKLRRATGREQLDILANEELGEGNEAGFIGDGNEGALDHINSLK
jgi:hypothetical protein